EAGDDYVYEFWFDVDRDFMIRAYHLTDRDGGAAHLDATEVARHQGVWVPTRAVRKSRLTGTLPWGEDVFELQEFSAHKVQPLDVQVDFPVGAGVVDEILAVNYVILPNGKYELYPQGNSSSGTLR